MVSIERVLLVNGSYMKGLDWDDERRYIMRIGSRLGIVVGIVIALVVMNCKLIWNWLLGWYMFLGFG
jgi:hypothetical protein